MAMTPLELVKAARKAVGDDMPDDICPDDLWGPVKGGGSRDKSASASATATTSSSSSSASLPGDIATVGTTTSAATTTTSSSSSGKSVRVFVTCMYVQVCLNTMS